MRLSLTTGTLIWGIFSLLLGIYLAFESLTVTSLILTTFVQVCLIFLLGKLLYKIHNSKFTLKNFFLVIFICAVISVVNFGTGISGIITGSGIPHFRTNILTNRCSLNVYTDTNDPWYFNKDCDISIAEKIMLLKQDQRVISMCQRNLSTEYWEGISCSDVLNKTSSNVQSSVNEESPQEGVDEKPPQVQLSVEEQRNLSETFRAQAKTMTTADLISSLKEDLPSLLKSYNQILSFRVSAFDGELYARNIKNPDIESALSEMLNKYGPCWGIPTGDCRE